jgi:hypothetical protein
VRGASSSTTNATEVNPIRVTAWCVTWTCRAVRGDASELVVPQAVLQRALNARIVFTPEGPGYTFVAPTRFDKLFTGIASPRPSFMRMGDLTGTEVIRPEDTPDAEYGLLLERAYGKGLASPMPASWNQIARWLKQIDGVRQAA